MKRAKKFTEPWFYISLTKSVSGYIVFSYPIHFEEVGEQLEAINLDLANKVNGEIL